MKRPRNTTRMVFGDLRQEPSPDVMLLRGPSPTILEFQGRTHC